MGYPIMLRLESRVCVIVGGGRVAARKVAGLLAAGAAVTVVAPDLHPELERLAAEGVITAQRERYTRDCLEKLRPLLVFAATDDVAVNRQVVEDARRLGALVSRADDGEAGDFATMATVRRGGITLAVSTGGASPALAAHLRDVLAETVGEEYAILVGWLGEVRPDIGTTVHTQEGRAAVWRAVLESPVLELLRQGDEAGARQVFDRLVNLPRGDE